MKYGSGIRDLTQDTNTDTVYTHPSSIQCNASSEISSLKSSVSNGKNLIANAITGKGVATSSSDTFATMASNINGLKVGLSDIQKLYIGGATWVFDTSSSNSTIEVVGESPTMYLRTESGAINSEVFSLRAYIYSNNAGSTIYFGWDNTRYYYSDLCTIGIAYNFTDDRFVCGVRIGSACKNATKNVYVTGGYIYVSLTCQPNIYTYEWHDDSYTGTCWWDAACTDNTSYKTITVRLSGTFYHYKDSSNHSGGYNYSISTANMYF